MSTEPTTETTAAAVAVVEQIPDNLQVVVKETGIEPITAQTLFAAYRPFMVAINQLLDDAKRVEVTDATQVTMIKHARELRLKLRAQRVAAEKTKDRLKADSLRQSNAVQGMFNVLKLMTEPIEEKLLAAEEFAERVEAKRKADLKVSREKELGQFGVDPQFYALADMPADSYQKLLDGAKAAHQQAEQAKAKAEADRIEKEKAEAAERERIRLENERLKREAEERQAREIAAFELGKKRVAAIVAEQLMDRSELDTKRAGELTENEFDNWLTRLRDAKAEKDRLILVAKEAADRAAAADAERKKLAEENARKMREAQKKTDRDLAALRKQKDDEQKAATEKARVEAAEQQRIRDIEAKRLKEESDRRLAELSRKADEAAAAKKKLEDEAEVRRQADEAAAARLRELAAGPDREKLLALAETIRALSLPELATDAGKAVGVLLGEQREKFAKWIATKAATL